MAINSVTFSGNVAADPRKFGDAENPGLSFSLAVTTVKKTENGYEDQPMYLQCSLFPTRWQCSKCSFRRRVPTTPARRARTGRRRTARHTSLHRPLRPS